MKFRVIPTNVHAAVDYVTAPALVAAPELLRLNGSRASAVAPRAAGLGAALYSALTDYELGVRRLIPMKAHLALDAATGALLAAAPWLFGSAREGARHWLPHALVGGSEVGLALSTETEPRRRGWRRAWTALPLPGRAAALVLSIVIAGTAAYVFRRRLFETAAVVAEGVEEVADAVEDLTDDIADAARERARDGEGER
jgi:hypothetical protein